MNYVDVYIEYGNMNVNQTFTYRCRESIQVGCRVRVPFGKNVLIGYVASISDYSDIENIKDVLEVLDKKPLLNSEMMALAQWMSKYYVCSMINCLKTMLPPALKPTSTHAKIVYEDWFVQSESNHPLTAKQKAILESTTFPIQASVFRKSAKSIANTLLKYGYIAIEKRPKTSHIVKRSIDDSAFILTSEQQAAIDLIQKSKKTVYLLHGVTGSGKTEVFLQLAQKILKQGRQVLFLVPEIGLTPLMIQRVSARFGSDIAIYHSQLSNQEKYHQYCLIRDHKVNIAIGTRSAVFLPFSDLGLILMDEEHDLSYKQENTPRYHTRDVAIHRAHYHHCKIVLASATPSLESYAKAYKHRYQLVTLTHRIYVNMPTIHLVDMRKEHVSNGVSKTLFDEIQLRLQRHEQTILLLNRRGYLPIVRCTQCNSVMTCPDCGIALAYHKKENNLVCHCCGRIFPYDNTCPKCGSHTFYQTSMGTEKLEEKLNEAFPQATIIRMDADNTRKKHAHEKLLKEFEAHGDILLGTQMVAKGLDYPNVTLVGIIHADASLLRMDFSSNEIGYDLLEQASGRSGRQRHPGAVYIQTFDPDQYVMQCVQSHNYAGFFQSEMRFRHLGNYPPYVYMCTVIYSHIKEEKAMEIALKAKQFLSPMIVIGPLSISMRQKRKRVRIVVKSKSQEKLNRAIWALVDYHHSLKTNVQQDINMYPLLLEE